MALVAKVAVSAALFSIDKPYSYLFSNFSQEQILPGVRVIVPFGKGNKQIEGVVLSVDSQSPDYALKEITSVLDDKPVLSTRDIQLSLWMRKRYFCTLFEAIKTILPTGLWYRHMEEVALVSMEDISSLKNQVKQSISGLLLLQLLLDNGGKLKYSFIENKLKDKAADAVRYLKKKEIITLNNYSERKVTDKMVKRVYLSIPAIDALQLAQKKEIRAPLQSEVLRLLSSVSSALANEIYYFTGANASVLKALEKAGTIEIVTEEAFRVEESLYDITNTPIDLNEEQQIAYEHLRESLQMGSFQTSLLYGITGSGKTLIYIRLVQECIKLGKTAIVLVPEIALTPQMMAKFTAYFGKKVAMLHSSRPLTERYDQWKRIRNGEIKVVLGTRSAIFAPLENVGLIVIDEEHESSYESESVPKYQTRDVAKWICYYEQSLLVLGSATPTIESTYYAKNGQYQWEVLRKRFNKKSLPNVEIVDMRVDLREGNQGNISRSLEQALRKNIEAGEQSILFLNRRGNSRMLLCGECGDNIECPNCSIPLTYHSSNDRLMCHYCGFSVKKPPVCPSCSGHWKMIGFGTQKIEEELHHLFPNTEVLRMDADTVSMSNGHEAILKKFDQDKVPILLGTQMVAKGLDFENVTLVGVLSADQGLYVDHYRAAEKTFSLITQVVGRSGRGEKQGRAIIQTFTPSNEVIVAAARQDYDSFYEKESKFRKLRNYPPYKDLILISVSNENEKLVLDACLEIKNILMKYLSHEATIYGPAPDYILRVNNHYHYRICISGVYNEKCRNLLSGIIRSLSSDKNYRSVYISIENNPMD